MNCMCEYTYSNEQLHVLSEFIRRNHSKYDLPNHKNHGQIHRNFMNIMPTPLKVNCLQKSQKESKYAEFGTNLLGKLQGRPSQSYVISLWENMLMNTPYTQWKCSTGLAPIHEWKMTSCPCAGIWFFFERWYNWFLAKMVFIQSA